jgi:hypothetical protein
MERFSVLWKEETFYDETIEMITECISTCCEIILFGHGYKSHSLRGAMDQFDDVTSNESNKVLQHSQSYSFFTTEGLNWISVLSIFPILGNVEI